MCNKRQGDNKMMMGFGLGFGLLGLLLMVLLWGGVILAAVWLIRALFPQVERPATATPVNSREILDRRYAQGEISRQEYESIKATLSR
jgi:putative membrane protein